MTTYRRNLLLVIEGMGSSAASTAGIAWNYGNATIASPGNYEIVGGFGTGAGMSAPPQSVACSVDPFECNLRGNGHTFQLHATEQAKSLFMRRPQKPRDTLNTEIDEDDTTLVFDGAGYTWSASEDGTVIWIGDEAIKLGSYAAGPQFTGCTRGMWSTTAQTQKAGMNVYAYNPKVVNRLARLFVYDRDAATITQAWQGFCGKPSVDGPVLSIPCQDIWSAVSGAEVNRGAPRGMERFATGRPVPRTQQIVGGSVIMAGDYQPRVNKSGADTPHWVALQVEDGLFFANYTEGSTPNSATWTDNGSNESAAQLGSIITSDLPDELTGGPPIYEVLCVHRRRDNVGNTVPSVANTRSSTRDLTTGIKFHPVAISMALLTSGYGIYPQGVAPVAQAAGDPADLAGPTQYLTSAENHIDRMSAKYLTSQCLIASRGDQGVQGPLTCIPEDGGSANWAVSSASPLGTNAHDVGGIAINAAGTYAWIWVEEDGTGTPTANSYALWRIDLSDGSVDYTAASTTSGESSAANALHVAIDETNGNIWVDQTDASNELNRHDLSTGADDGVTANDGGLGTLCAFCMSPDDDFLIAIGDSEYIAQWAIPITGTGNLFDGYSTDRVSFGSGGDTTNAITSMQRNRGGGRLEPARDGSNTVWFCAGDSTSDDPFVYQYDPDVATVANRVITELDPSSDMDYTDTGTAHTRDIAIDKDGKIYCLVLPGSSGVDYDIVRYDSDGTFDLSFRAEGVTIMANATYGLATRIAVSEDYVVWVSTEDGYIITYEQ
jgi:hypothetical protein